MGEKSEASKKAADSKENPDESVVPWFCVLFFFVLTYHGDERDKQACASLGF